MACILCIDQNGLYSLRRRGFSTYEYFEALPPEKRRRVVNAALEAFGRYGYQKTSAEQIAQSAGIGKGMLFRYFGSKQGIYAYLFEYVRAFLAKWFDGLPGAVFQRDYIEQYRDMIKIKFRAYQENRHVFEFLTMLFNYPENLEISSTGKTYYDEVLALRAQTLSALRLSGNTAPFRTDVDVERAKKYIALMVEGYSQSLIADMGGPPLAEVADGIYWQEFDQMLDDMKRLFYQQK